MFSKVLLLLFLVQFACAGVWVRVGQASIGTKGNSYHELVYNGENYFVGAVKLVYLKGYVANRAGTSRSYWGSSRVNTALATLITDAQNRIVYPSPRVTEVSKTGWYAMPGYTINSPELIFSDFGAPQYFNKGRKVRVWYGEDLFGFTEGDNHGKVYMDVYFYLL